MVLIRVLPDKNCLGLLCVRMFPLSDRGSLIATVQIGIKRNAKMPVVGRPAGKRPHAAIQLRKPAFSGNAFMF